MNTNIRSASDRIMSASDVKENFIIDSNSTSDRCVFDGNQTFTFRKQLMVESNGSAIAKEFLGKNMVLLAPNIIFIGQLEKDIGL